MLANTNEQYRCTVEHLYFANRPNAETDLRWISKCYASVFCSSSVKG